MSKAVLLSIKPQYCELIASGKKTLEVRKTRPKLETPFKCYIYCTKGEKLCKLNNRVFFDGKNKKLLNQMPEYSLNGRIIGEFICDKIEDFEKFEYSVDTVWRHIKLNACINYDEICKYLGVKKCGYGWNISSLVIYDKPKELNEFRLYDCSVKIEDGYPMPTHEIKRPPQSWCYVEELECL